ncbi:MAG: GAP family protein [Candidatus Paceibacterota bacterium]
MGIEAQLPTIITVMVAAAIDSINPCAIGVLILMLSVVLGSGGSTKRMVFLGLLYTLAVFIVYLAAGIGLVYYFASIPLYIAEYLSITVAVFLVFAGLIEIKDYFWYGKWFSLSIPQGAAKKIHDYAAHTSAVGVIFLGAFVSAVELPCTGAPYIAIITVLSQYFDFTAFLLLVLYNLIFVSPLIVIICLIAAGKKLQDVQHWKDKSRGTMRLMIGFLLVGLSWFLILIANGTINLG